MANLNTFRVAELRALMKDEQISEPERGSGAKGNIIKPDLIEAIETHRSQKVRRVSPKRRPASPKRRPVSPRRKTVSPRRKKLTTVSSIETVLVAYEQAWKDIDNMKKTKLNAGELEYVVVSKTKPLKPPDEYYAPLVLRPALKKKLKNKLFSVAKKSKLAFIIEFQKYFSNLFKIPNHMNNVFIIDFFLDVDERQGNHFVFNVFRVEKDGQFWYGNIFGVTYGHSGYTREEQIDGAILSGRFMTNKTNPVYFTLGQRIMDDDFNNGPFKALLIKMDEINKKYETMKEIKSLFDLPGTKN